MAKRITHIAFILLGFWSLQSCFKNLEEPELINEEELISTVFVTLTNQQNETTTLSYQDLDGDGPLEPLIEVSGTLQPNRLYYGKIEALNETEFPSINMTEEIVHEGVDHQFFYTLTGLDAVATPTDLDENGNVLGTTFTLQTGEISQGTLQIILRHLPAKPNDGNPDTAGGETDLQVRFSIAIN